MIHNAKDLPPDQRAVIERLLGRAVLENETISIRAFEPPALSDQRRHELAEQLENILLRWMRADALAPGKKLRKYSPRR